MLSFGVSLITRKTPAHAAVLPLMAFVLLTGSTLGQEVRPPVDDDSKARIEQLEREVQGLKSMLQNQRRSSRQH
jgi:hypothetical protein